MVAVSMNAMPTVGSAIQQQTSNCGNEQIHLSRQRCRSRERANVHEANSMRISMVRGDDLVPHRRWNSYLDRLLEESFGPEGCAGHVEPRAAAVPATVSQKPQKDTDQERECLRLVVEGGK